MNKKKYITKESVEEATSIIFYIVVGWIWPINFVVNQFLQRINL